MTMVKQDSDQQYELPQLPCLGLLCYDLMRGLHISVPPLSTPTLTYQLSSAINSVCVSSLAFSQH